MACPICGSQSFYVKDPEDAFECIEFDLIDGQVRMDPEDGDVAPRVGDNVETYCGRCAWHGKLETLKKQRRP
jgi:hypothetical protein